MKCLLCTTDLPVDSNSKTIVCPKCGSEYAVVIRFNKLSANLAEYELSAQKQDE